MEKDPLDHQRCFRWSLRWLVLDLPVLAILLSLVWFFLELIRDPGRYVVAHEIKEFVPSAGMFALVGAALGVFYNVRLTARSKNRQEWINSIRKNIHALISNCPPQGGRDQEHSRKCEIGALELLINPSERVHRSLLTIIRYMYGIHDHAPDRKVLCGLRLPTPPGQQVSDNEQVNQRNFEELKVKATRLANVLLKREWEQVKHVK